MVSTAGTAGWGHGSPQGSLHFSAATTWQQSHPPRVNSSSRLWIVRGGGASFTNDSSFRVHLRLPFCLHFQGLAFMVKLLGEPALHNPDCVEGGRLGPG